MTTSPSPIASLLVHEAVVYTKNSINAGGRVTDTWVSAGTIKCRFTIPNVMPVPIVNGVAGQQFATRVFTGLDFLGLINAANLPVRLVTSDSVWDGTYEMATSPKVFTAHSKPHHVEINAVKVSNE